MNNKNTLILAAGGALLVGGIATAAFLAGGASKQADLAATSTGLSSGLDGVDPDTLPAGAQLTQADVVAVSPVRTQRQVTATVTQSTPIMQTVNSTRAEQQCNELDQHIAAVARVICRAGDDDDAIDRCRDTERQEQHVRFFDKFADGAEDTLHRNASFRKCPAPVQFRHTGGAVSTL